MTLSGVAALEEWCRRALDGSGVQVTNMTSAWRDGLAFCALIHRYRPDLIDLAKLDTRDWKGNLELAFYVAENQLGIASLLDPEDLLSTPSPDRFSILTYLSQFYHTFCQVDSGISSCNQSPVLSDNELESSFGSSGSSGYNSQLRRRSSIAGTSGGSRSTANLDQLATRLLRSNSTVGTAGSRRRGAIHSLMDGRRVRSLSCGGGAGRRGLRHNPPDSQPPIQSENPFNDPELMQGINDDTKRVVEGIVEGSNYHLNNNNKKISNNNCQYNNNSNKENKRLRSVSENKIDQSKSVPATTRGDEKTASSGNTNIKSGSSEVKKVNLREKKHRGGSGGAGADEERRQRVTKSLILETDFSESIPSTTLTNSVDMHGSTQLRTSVSNLREKSSSTLSFTSIPSPYRRQDILTASASANSGQSSLTLLSKSCSYRNISSAPPKPLRTYTHNLHRQSSVPPEIMEYKSGGSGGAYNNQTTAFLSAKMSASMNGHSTIQNGSNNMNNSNNEIIYTRANGTKSEMNLSHAVLHDRSNLLHDRSNLLTDRCSRTPLYAPSSMSLGHKFSSCLKTSSQNLQNIASPVIEENNTAIRETVPESNTTNGTGVPRMGVQAAQSPPKRQTSAANQHKQWAEDVNNNEMKERFTNYPIRKLTPESSFRHLVKLRLTTDIFRRITSAAAGDTGKRTAGNRSKDDGNRKASSTAKSLPYLQTLV